MAGRDITESLPLNIGNPGTSGFWVNNAETYDIAIGGVPFFIAPSDNAPYQRETAPYRKDQFDNGKEPGEQSLTGWWMRSQASFHVGDGIKFYDPSSGEVSPYRFADSRGVDVWTKGQVTLLPEVQIGHISTGPIAANGRPNQHLRSIKWNNTSGVLMLDEYDIDKIDGNGNEIHFVNYNSGTDTKVYGMCDDGTTAYWVTNDVGGGNKLAMYKKALTLDYTTPGTAMLSSASITVDNAVLEYTKERIVACINNSVYEIPTSATTLPTAVYTHPSTSYVFTSIASSGPAIYVAGYNGIQSSIIKFTLKTDGSMPTLAAAVVAAEMPVGEVIYKIYYYLGNMLIGTNKGIRLASVNEQDGSLSYGPLIVETSQPCYDFAARDRFVWCATSVDGTPGVIRIDLGTTVEGETITGGYANQLRFAWANDLNYEGSTDKPTTALAFLDGTSKLAFTTASTIAGTSVTNKAKTSGVVTLTTSTAHGLSVGDSIWVDGVTAVGGSVFNSGAAPVPGPFTITEVPTTTTFKYALTGADVAPTAVSATTAVVVKPGNIYVESPTGVLRSSGYLTTGAIRYSTLEPKHFKFIRARGDYTYGSMDIQSIDVNNNIYNVITYNGTIGSPEAATTEPEGSQEYVSFKFTLTRSATTTTAGPVFKGYQLKALPATKRSHLIQFPVWCFDFEKDRYGVEVGYKGRAFERLQELEAIEDAGDIINIQDFRTEERIQGIIEKQLFVNSTPPSGDFSGFGGKVYITIRTVL